MPIEYTVYNDGDLVHVTSHGSVTEEDIVNLKMAISCDERIKPQASQLFEVMPGSTMNGNHDSVLRKIRQKQDLTKKAGYRCAVFAPFKDKMAWELADCYRVISELHSPGSVVLLFADIKTAKRWLGINGNELATN
jgi:hypothetical protein